MAVIVNKRTGYSPFISYGVELEYQYFFARTICRTAECAYTHSPDVKITNHLATNLLLDECMTLWGEPERVYVQNVEQLHVSSECN